VTYEIFHAPRLKGMLEAISDRRVRAKLIERIDGLAEDPELQGKALTDELRGYRSLRAVGQRYRVIYRVERAKVTVVIVAAGIRKAGSREDIYELARKLLRLGLLR
jgi:mRNA interferase RelE/StbE